jgi:hypothetical protein
MADEVNTNQPIVNWSHQTLTLNLCNRMANEDMANQKEKYFKATLWFIRMLIPYLTDKERISLEVDMKMLADKTNEIKDNLESEAAKYALNELREDFANTHVSLGFSAFNRSGIVYTTDDGELDFDKLALAKVQQIVQTPFDDKGLDRAIDKALEPEGK